MMGRQVAQGSLFYGFRLDDHVPACQSAWKTDPIPACNLDPSLCGRVTPAWG